uniref:Putative secreted protein n=1 Tax=Ixodes ricinus TaxID=34613 RepID=A0A6B0UX32_IXORI
MDVLAFSVALTPALVMEMVCCSMASWMATWSLSSILSNSSMQQTPLSASMRAPASMTNSCDSSSRTTAAVRPAALDALPLVYTARGANSDTCLRNWLLAVLGSPTTQTLMSPRRVVPSTVFLGTPPNSMIRMPRLISSLPWMVGNRLEMRLWYRFLSWLME